MDDFDVYMNKMGGLSIVGESPPIVYIYIKMNVPYRIVNYAFDHVMIFSKVVAHEQPKVSK